ncbi:acetate--CoA ligase family protein [Patescibacteria group bacterium]
MEKSKENLKKLFNPQNIAVIGASDEKGSVGFSLMNNLQKSGFKGKIFPVNPYRKKVFRLDTFPTIKDVPEKIDLALVATPAPTVPEVMVQCGQVEVAGAVIISSGFKEVGGQGQELYQRLEKVVQKYSTRVIGPNCLGYLKPSQKVNASFALQNAKEGRVAFISQSGALGASVFDWAILKNIGFSYFVSVGEMVDVGFADLLDYLSEDSETTSAILYIETVKDPARFIESARRFSLKKPMVVLKAGKSEEGAKAALSHTGSIVGDSLVFEAVLKKAGALRVDTLQELFDNTRSLAMQPLPKGNRLAIVTNAGGAAVIATDILVESGGALATISKQSQAKLKSVLPPAANVKNPIDILGDADPKRYRIAVQECLDDKQIDGVLVILAPQAMSDPVGVAKTLVGLPRLGKKTLLASWMGGQEVSKGIEVLQKHYIPAFQYPERAAKTFINLYNYSLNQELLREKPKKTLTGFKPDKRKIFKLLQVAQKEKRNFLTELESKVIFSAYGIPVPPGELVHSKSQAVKMAKKIGLPVVLKISSPGIFHKTDFKGVELDLDTFEELEVAYDQVLKNYSRHFPKSPSAEVLVEKMIKKRFELFLGSKNDVLFGPVVLFGQGGIAVEVFKDYSAGLPPLNSLLAERMIKATKIYRLLKGYRNMKAVDLPALGKIICQFSRLVADFPEFESAEINPLAADEKGMFALDAKIALKTQNST